ncbi:MAG: hypothetical protein DRP47_00035 [Candidatus Zixiibacteriota bacterium]|nr:MAG: hypothetical protein DRP47_00035 [candidate division Zixibacteria bacterium]
MEKESVDRKVCINCGRPLIRQKGIWICAKCNPRAIDTTDIFVDDISTEEQVFIECPGATLYDSETGEVTEGVKWIDDNDVTKGFEIVGNAIYAPNHKPRRRIKVDSLGKIRRCRACQDYTIRMRRPEGRDFFIPSVKHPRRNKLKPMNHVSVEP